MQVTRYASAKEFLDTALPVLMRAEAENNLIIGVAQGIARSPSAVKDPYLAAVSSGPDVLACAVYFSPFKLVLTGAEGEPAVALAEAAFRTAPDAEGVIGPDRAATDFARAWGRLSGVDPRPGTRLRIHETHAVMAPDLPMPSGALRQAGPDDQALLSRWTEKFVAEVRLPEKVDAPRVVRDSIQRGRLYVWEDGAPMSMAAWSGKTPNGVRINFVYTPQELRCRGYGTACVSALTRQELAKGSTFCWLYTDLSSAASPNIFKRIGYRPVSDLSEYYF